MLDFYGSGIAGWRAPATIDAGNDGPTYTSLYQGVDYGYHDAQRNAIYVLCNTGLYSIL